MQLGMASWQSNIDRVTLKSPDRSQPESNQANQAPVIDDFADQFPELEIHSLLGQGGMGVVYKARQRALDRLVALKIITPAAANEPGFAERFTREARVLARLNHSHIIAIYDFGQRNGLFYLLMEFVDGVNLRQLIREKALSPSQALEIVPGLCEALQYAHNEGVVHRDIKPENILLDRKGRIKIADFGLAKMLSDHASDAVLTGTRQVVGTPQYMAPEQMQGASSVDHRADLYSLGVVFYEMLTGELPIGRFEPPSRHVSVDIRLDEVVLRTLERDRERRYQHASDIKSAIQTISTTPQPRPAQTVSHARGNSGVVSIARSGLRWICDVPTKLSRTPRIIIGVFVLLPCVLWIVSLTPIARRQLVNAAEQGNVTKVNGWLAIGTDPNSRLDEGGDTALMRASGQGHLAIAKRLLDCGASPDAANSNGINPLMWASWQGQEKVVELLLGHHATVTSRCNEEETALHKAAFRGQTSIAKKLIEAGSRVDDSDRNGETALLLAATRGHLSTVQLLLDRSATCNVATRDGVTPLMAAARHGHSSVVNVLLPISLPAAVDGKGDTAMAYAIAGGSQAVIDALVTGGVPPTRTLWIWRGFRAAQVGNFAEANTLFDKAESIRETAVMSRSCQFTADAWEYNIPVAAGFAELASGMCHQRNGQSELARESFRKAFDRFGQSNNSIVVFHRTHERSNEKRTQRFELQPTEIKKHIDAPGENWSFQVAVDHHTWNAGVHGSSSGSETLTQKDLFP